MTFNRQTYDLSFGTAHLADPLGTLINKIIIMPTPSKRPWRFWSIQKQRIATEILMKLPAHEHWNLKIFLDRDAGLHWLQQQPGNNR
jgi:hypothetical protein